MIKRITFVLFIFLSCFTSANAQSYSEDSLSKVFKKIIRTDQSNVRNNEKRHPIFLNNFEQIKAMLADSVNLNTDQALKKRTLKRLHLGLTMTFIHTMQTNPQLMMNEETSAFFAEQIKLGRINIKELRIALKAYQTDVLNNRFSEESADYFNQRIASVKSQWGIK